jgi:hypothetical protein
VCGIPAFVPARRDGTVIQPLPEGDDTRWNDEKEQPDRAEAGCRWRPGFAGCANECEPVSSGKLTDGNRVRGAVIWNMMQLRPAGSWGHKEWAHTSPRRDGAKGEHWVGYL